VASLKDGFSEGRYLQGSEQRTLTDNEKGSGIASLEWSLMISSHKFRKSAGLDEATFPVVLEACEFVK